GIRIKPVTVELEEDGVRIALTIVDTPGFGDNIDNEFCFQTVLFKSSAKDLSTPIFEIMIQGQGESRLP
ncbi:6485_t:CDS:2, partial [Acaulospora morrowiae]